MSAAGVRFQGLDELKAGLRRVAADLTDEARRLARDAAIAARDDIARQYPARTGHLRRQVQVVGGATSAFGASLRVISAARYARFVDARLHVLVPTMVRYRAQFYRNVAEVIRRAGFEVRQS